jgi:NADPH:quinone reductase-like Zn-dependent oxidoreductase
LKECPNLRGKVCLLNNIKYMKLPSFVKKHPFITLGISIVTLLLGLSFTEDTWVLPAGVNNAVGIPLLIIGALGTIGMIALAFISTRGDK